MASLPRIAVIPLLALLACEGEQLSQIEDPPPEPVVVPVADATDVQQEPPFGEVEIVPAKLPVYIHSGESLFSYDPDTNAAEWIGDFTTRDGPLDGVVDIAIDLDGRMYGGTLDQEIYQIDPETAEASFRFSFDDILHGLTFLADGTLVVAGERVSLVDPRNGRLERELVAANGTYHTSGDIVGLPDGQLYWTVRGGGNGDGVVRLNPNNGGTLMLGEASIDRIFGLGYAEGRLYGFSSTGFVVTIDPDTGDVLDQSALEGSWWGATTNPVLWDN